MTNTMDHIEIFENDRAANYDQFVSTWIPNYQFVIDVLPGVLKNFTTTGHRALLVAGCGTGNEIQAIRDAGLDWPITGVDPSPVMIELAQKKLKGCADVTWVEGQVSDLPLDPLYGAATLLLVLHFLPDNGAKHAILKDIADRLQPEAPLVLMDIFGSSSELKSNLQVLRSFLPPHLDQEQVDDRIERIESKIHYVPERRLIVLLEEVGFERPRRFFQTAIYGGWIARKAKK